MSSQLLTVYWVISLWVTQIKRIQIEPTQDSTRDPLAVITSNNKTACLKKSFLGKPSYEIKISKIPSTQGNELYFNEKKKTFDIRYVNKMSFRNISIIQYGRTTST